MKIFISWSGSASKSVAESLKEWLPYLMQSVEPWVSSADIKAGKRWGQELDRELESTDFGILCLTEDNLSAPWIHFEAGALAKSLEDSHLIPYLIGISPFNLTGPLALFQSLSFDREGTWNLVQTIYKNSSNSNITEIQLSRLFENFWPDLEKQLNNIELKPKKERVVRSERSMLEELLLDIRLIKRQLPTKPFLDSYIYEESNSTHKDKISLVIDARSVSESLGAPEYIVDGSESFQGFLNILWEDIAKIKCSAYTYGQCWVLVNLRDGQRIEKQSSGDTLTVGELGFAESEKLTIELIG